MAFAHISHILRRFIIGDFNLKTNQECMEVFCETYSLTHFLKEPARFKNPGNPLCIDLVLTENTRRLGYLTFIGWPELLHKQILKDWIQKSHTIRAKKSFVILDLENISYLHYCLKTLILTSVNLKSSFKYVSRLWTILHHVRKNTLDRKQVFHEQNFETRQDEKKWFQKKIFQKQVWILQNDL